jgi:hypothetical protein
MTSPTVDRMLSLAELATESGLKKVALYRLIEKGELACVRTCVGTGKRKTSGRIYVQRSDWDDWVARHRTPAKRELSVPATPRPKRPALDLPGADLFLR